MTICCPKRRFIYTNKLTTINEFRKTEKKDKKFMSWAVAAAAAATLIQTVRSLNVNSIFLSFFYAYAEDAENEMQYKTRLC